MDCTDWFECPHGSLTLWVNPAWVLGVEESEYVQASELTRAHRVPVASVILATPLPIAQPIATPGWHGAHCVSVRVEGEHATAILNRLRSQRRAA